MNDAQKKEFIDVLEKLIVQASDAYTQFVATLGKVKIGTDAPLFYVDSRQLRYAARLRQVNAERAILTRRLSWVAALRHDPPRASRGHAGIPALRHRERANRGDAVHTDGRRRDAAQSTFRRWKVSKTITIEIPEEHAEAVYLGIGMIKNLRETGDHELSGEDALRRGLQVRPMNEDQMRSVLGLKKIMADLQEARFK